MLSLRRWFVGKEKSAPREKRVARSSSLSTQMTVKDTAEFYFQALDGGFVEVEEVIAWADDIILKEEDPDLAIIEVSMSASKGKYEMMRSLSKVPGHENSEVIRKRILIERKKVLLEMSRKLSEDTDYLPSVIYYLFGMLMDDEITGEDIREQIYQLEDEFEYIASMSKGKHRKLAEKTVAFLTNYARLD